MAENTEIEEVKANSQAAVEKKEPKKKEPVKASNAERQSRIMNYLKEEHKWENYVLLFLSLFALTIGLLLLTKTLKVSADFPLIGNFPKGFAIILVVLSSFSLILALFPFFKPAWPELKKVTWPNARLFLGNTVRTFMFLIILVLLFLLYDAFISEIISRIL